MRRKSIRHEEKRERISKIDKIYQIRVRYMFQHVQWKKIPAVPFFGFVNE